MAILVVRIEDASTLLMNEFFDYNGRCYALTRSRKENTDVCINLEDFYVNGSERKSGGHTGGLCKSTGWRLGCDRVL